MKTKLLFFLASLVLVLTFFLITTYLKALNRKKEYKKLKMINEFLISITTENGHGPRLELLMVMDLESLKSLEYQLMEYYKKTFFQLITKSSIDELEAYLKCVGQFHKSPQREFIKTTLKKEIFYEQGANLVDIIFRLIKLTNTEKSEHGQILKKFLLDDVNYLKERREFVNVILLQCKKTFEKISVEENIKVPMINELDGLIYEINQ